MARFLDSAMSEAKPLALKQNLQLPVWLYASVEIPQALNGYSMAGLALNAEI